MLTHIEFENYRIFKKRQALDIKPITILFGKNNAGKSAVLKLPLLSISIGKTAADGFVNPFDLEVMDIKIANSYRDLIYGRGNQSTSFMFANNFGNKTDISFHVDLDKLIFENTFHERKSENVYSYIDYIGPFRETPDLDIRIDNRLYMVSGYYGNYAYQQLLRDSDSSIQTINDKVSKWYQDNFEGWSIEVNNKQNPVFHIEMKNNGHSIPIQDCGTGIIQSLPIVIRACKQADNPTLVVLEEPESHLNPAAHAELCQLIVDSTKIDFNKRYLIETHSHTFILRLQRLLAEGKISPDDVALYHVQYNEAERSSQLERIEMMQDGSIPQWPKGMFQDVMKELMVINNARFGS